MTAVSGSLDANVLLRLILRDIPKLSDDALRLIEKGQRFHVADIAVMETAFALERYYNMPRSEIAEVIQILANDSKLILNRNLFEKAVVDYARFPKLSFEDCCLATYATLNNALPLWTFDQKLSKQLSGAAKLLSAN